MEQKGEVGVNSAFAKLMTGQEQVMDLDKNSLTHLSYLLNQNGGGPSPKRVT